MQKVVVVLLAVAVCANVAMASYSYTVSGKVYYSGSGLPVPKNTPVTFTANFTGGGSVQNTVYTAADGSFSVNHSLAATNPIGASMSLKAVTGLCSGSKSWTCNNISETKDVWVSCNVQINPDLSVVVHPVNFAHAGTQLPVTAVAFLDQPGAPVVVQNFQVKLAWNPAQMNVVNVQTSPDSKFDVISWSPTGPGSAMVIGEANSVAVELPIPPTEPESFFDVFFEVTVPSEEMPIITTVTVVPMETQLSNMGLYYYPYQHQTDYLIGEPEKCKATFMIETAQEWQEVLDFEWPKRSISPILESEWEKHMALWTDPCSIKDGEPYPPNTFLPSELYVYGGGGGGGLDPCDAGLVMLWGTGNEPNGSYASAFRYDYGLDPDLRNKTITITVTAPQFGPSGQINAVSFAINDMAGLRRWWWWSVGNPPAPIPWNVPTVVTINTAIAGIGATTPAATGYVSNPGFNLAQAQSFDVDENFQWIFQPGAIPPPGQPTFMGMWNYWHNLMVTENTAARKWFYIKYSQKPDVIDANQPPRINGWDEKSVYQPQPNPIMADDWECTDNRPITDVHWWGSFIGWTQPHLPPVLPKAFHIGIWTDVPDPNPTDPQDYSHPGTLIWENTCTSWVWNFAGYDVDPRPNGMENEACFQFTQLLSEDEWFYQKPDENQVYWLSIAAIYDQNDWQNIQQPWGWKTRPHQFNDDAIQILTTADGLWPPKLGSAFGSGTPIALPPYPDPLAVSWDLAFELSTNEPKAPASADLDYDGFVDLDDLRIFATQWLTAQP
jgi:hypothetical protein